MARVECRAGGRSYALARDGAGVCHLAQSTDGTTWTKIAKLEADPANPGLWKWSLATPAAAVALSTSLGTRLVAWATNQADALAAAVSPGLPPGDDGPATGGAPALP